MGKIKIYDADAFMRKEAEMACHTFKQIAILEGPRGVIVAEQEAVHDVFDSLDRSFSFDLTKIPSPGHMYVVPSHKADIPIRMLKDKAPFTEMEFYDFFSRRDHNIRCENNFRYLCDRLRQIGYEIPKESLADKVRKAGAKAAARNERADTASPERV